MAKAREKSAWSAAVAAQVRAERAALNLSQDEVVALTGMSKSNYRRIEKDTHVPDTTEIARLCGVFRIPVSEFYRRVEARDPEAIDLTLDRA